MGKNIQFVFKAVKVLNNLLNLRFDKVYFYFNNFELYEPSPAPEQRQKT